MFELAAAGLLAGLALGTGDQGRVGAVLCPGGALLFDAAGWEAPDRGLVEPDAHLIAGGIEQAMLLGDLGVDLRHARVCHVAIDSDRVAAVGRPADRAPPAAWTEEDGLKQCVEHLTDTLTTRLTTGSLPAKTW